MGSYNKYKYFKQLFRTPEFEIKDTPFRIDKNDSLNTLSPMENSRFSHSTGIGKYFILFLLLFYFFKYYFVKIIFILICINDTLKLAVNFL